MNGIALMFRKEALNFIHSDRSVFFVYLMLVAGWGMLIASTEYDGLTATLWLVFFSVIIAANFASTVFVAERMTGSLEILLTSGVSRGAIVYGKIVFVVVMTLSIGALCGSIGMLFRPLLGSAATPLNMSAGLLPSVLLYVSATIFNASASACFSVWMPNPRLLHFINLVVLGAVMAVYAGLSVAFPLPLYAVSVFLTIAGVIFLVLARRAFESERIVKPVIF